MKPLFRMMCLALCAGLLLTAGACAQTQEESSSQISTPSVSVVENEPTPTPTPTPTPSPTPTVEPTQEPTPAPAGDFEAAFEENPIDAALEEDMMYATSTSLISRAYDNAANRWLKVIDTACATGEATLPKDVLTQFLEEQAAWEASLDSDIQAIRDENSEDGLASAEAVMNHYRDRAKALCQTVYEATGNMPEFPSTDDEAQG
jgi:hypothetical protein